MTRLKQELDALDRYLQRVRQEVASIDRPADEDHRFDNMGSQLEAIVNATEEATNTIMEAVESNQSAVETLRDQISDPGQITLLDQVTGNVAVIFEACSFQDITGQRVNKVFQSISYVEERVNAIVEVWGKEYLEKADVLPSKTASNVDELICGPQLEGDGLSQEDIDSLFD